MRFNAEAYEKCFPPKAEVEKVESVVETFKPTEEALKDEDKEQEVEKMVEDVKDVEDVSDKEEENGDRQLDHTDSE